MKSEIELFPCPFCGQESEIVRYGNPRQSTQYACTECGCCLETGEEWNHGRRWNERHYSKDLLKVDSLASSIVSIIMQKYPNLISEQDQSVLNNDVIHQIIKHINSINGN